MVQRLPRDNAMERRYTRLDPTAWDLHVVECSSEDDVEVCPTINKHSVEFDLATVGATMSACLPG